MTDPMIDPRNRDLKTLWQAQAPEEGGTVSLEVIRQRALVLEKVTRRKDAIMWVSGVTNIGAFAAVMWYLPHLRVVAAIVIATALYIVYQYYRRRPSRVVLDGFGNACVDFYRAALIRKRDMARQLWSWFLPPAILGQVALIVGFIVSPPNVPRRLVLMALPFWLLTDVIVFTIGWRNAQREAGKTQRELDALDAASRGDV
jgi:hypothetical protein